MVIFYKKVTLTLVLFKKFNFFLIYSYVAYFQDYILLYTLHAISFVASDSKYADFFFQFFLHNPLPETKN